MKSFPVVEFGVLFYLTEIVPFIAQHKIFITVHVHATESGQRLARWQSFNSACILPSNNCS